MRWLQRARLASPFQDDPPALRRCRLELETVVQGVRRHALLFLPFKAAEAAVALCRDAKLGCAVAPGVRPNSFLQAGTREREILKQQRKLAVAIGPTPADAARLLRAWTHDYAATGDLLGYPACCVAWAAAQDVRTFQPLYGQYRQANLVEAALTRSRRLDLHCNTFLRESALADWGPAALIPHYPCRCDCAASVKVAGQAKAVLSHWRPTWSLFLAEALCSPVLWWSDRHWPAHFWDEYAGLALLGGHLTSRSPVEVVEAELLPLGFGRTPAGVLPEGRGDVWITRDAVEFELEDEEAGLSHVANGAPLLLAWSEGRRLRPGAATRSAVVGRLRLAASPWSLARPSSL